jgi:hypothetical protein
VDLPGTGKGGLKQASFAHSRGAAVEREKTSVERESISLIDPYGVAHFESACSVLR